MIRVIPMVKVLFETYSFNDQEGDVRQMSVYGILVKKTDDYVEGLYGIERSPVGGGAITTEKAITIPTNSIKYLYYLKEEEGSTTVEGSQTTTNADPWWGTPLSSDENQEK